MKRFLLAVFAISLLSAAPDARAADTGARTTFNSVSVTSVTTTATLVLATNILGRHGAQCQNQSAAVVFCSDRSTLVAATLANVAFVLKAGTGAADGTGGQVAIPPGYAGPLWCLTSSGTANVTCDDF